MRCSAWRFELISVLRALRGDDADFGQVAA
jgi:hypothetical protein